MKGFYILLIVIVVIITVSKSIMEYLKVLDRRNGLEIDDKNYTVGGTLFSSNKQQKRIKKENKKTFKEYNIDSVLWKKGFILFMVSALCAIGESFCVNKEITPILLISIVVVIQYFSVKMFYLIMANLIFILLIFDISNYLVAVLIIFPTLILYNYVVIKDYIKYRKEAA